MIINFDDYSYYPALRTRVAEMRGLHELDAERKNRILPLITLGQWPRALEFQRSIDRACEAMGERPFIVDLTAEADRLPNEHSQLTNAHNAFENWRNFVEKCSTAIPTVLLTQGARTRDLVRQAVLFEQIKGKLAFRIRDFPSDTATVISALSAMDDPTNAIIFIDSQYIRSALAAYVTATIATINAIRNEFPEAIVATLATSFPASTISFADQSQERGTIEMLERELYDRVGGSGVAIYGDHASIHSVVYDNGGVMRWSPRIDYPRFRDWYFERRSGMSPEAGYIAAAQAVVSADPEIGTRGIWGESMIVQAANGNPYAKAPASWISVRSNIHMARQIDLANQPLDEDDEDDETL